MPLNNLSPLRWNPRGVADILDDGQAQPGAMTAAINMVFDPTTPFTLQCRPAADLVTDFSTAGLSFPSTVTAAQVVGDVVYGLITSQDVPGYDYPFAYDLINNVFLAVSGTKTTATLPKSAVTYGEWIPPLCSSNGIYVVVTHPGFSGGIAPSFGWFDITTPLAPIWNAGNTATNALPEVPQCVGTFNNRFYFGVGNTAYYTDPLTLTITNASQSLAVGDVNNITCFVGLPYSSSNAGILQALMAFKSTAIGMIMGDDALGNLSLNILNDEVGCDAPRAAIITPEGIAFPAADGIRLLQLSATLTPPDDDLRSPFINAYPRSRMSAAYNDSIYRICLNNLALTGQPVQEYWFDTIRRGWTGPHTFQQDLALPWRNTFLLFNSAAAPGMYKSDGSQSEQSDFTELNSLLTWQVATAPLQDDGGLYENSATLTVWDMQLPTDGTVYNFTAFDIRSGLLSATQVQANQAGTIWGQFKWGGALWQAALPAFLDRYNIPWTNPLVFSRLILVVNGPSGRDFKLGKMTTGYQPLQYVRTP